MNQLWNYSGYDTGKNNFGWFTKWKQIVQETFD